MILTSDILRTCHLMPCFGNSNAFDLGWTAATVLDEAPVYATLIYHILITA